MSVPAEMAGKSRWESSEKTARKMRLCWLHTAEKQLALWPCKSDNTTGSQLECADSWPMVALGPATSALHGWWGQPMQKFEFCLLGPSLSILASITFVLEPHTICGCSGFIIMAYRFVVQLMQQWLAVNESLRIRKMLIPQGWMF